MNASFLLLSLLLWGCSLGGLLGEAGSPPRTHTLLPTGCSDTEPLHPRSPPLRPAGGFPVTLLPPSLAQPRLPHLLL